MKILTLPEVTSTNTFLSGHREDFENLSLLRAVSQTGGRGQRGNSWEAEPGKNLTFSILFTPAGIHPREQFSISEATVLGICDYLASHGVKGMVKWPNDVYVGDKKIAGILIENSLCGAEILSSIIGVGINVNQKVFLSDAPNPVSLSLLTGLDYDLGEETRTVARSIEKRLLDTEEASRRAELHRDYLSVLWRGTGSHPFRDKASGNLFEARIADIEPDGILVLEEVSGTRRKFAFKETEFIL